MGNISAESKRILITMPVQTKQRLKQFAALNHMDPSVVVQQAVTKMSSHVPSEEDIKYKKTEKDSILITFSGIGLRLLEMWSEQTGVTKSKLVTYALQKAIENEEENGGTNYE